MEHTLKVKGHLADRTRSVMDDDQIEGGIPEGTMAAHQNLSDSISER
jgi:hypothetical protein